MFYAGKFKSFKTDPSNDDISKKENSCSFDNDITSNRFKEDLLSLADFPNFSSEKKTVQSTMTKQKLQLNSGSPFAQVQNAVTIQKSMKRPYSKPCPKSKKKYRRESSSFNEDEKNIDDDLLGLVGSINTDKNLDSDSSNDDCIEFNDTIIVDDNIPFGQQSNCTDTNLFKEKTPPTSAFFNSSLKSYTSTDGSKHQTFAVEKKKGVGLKSSVPVFKEIMPSSFSRNNISSTSSTLLSNPVSTKKNDNDSQNSKCAKEKESKIPESKVSILETSLQNPISNNSSGECQTNKTLNCQSIYASMGLDEDLCDTEPSSTKVSNSVAIEINETTLSPEKSNLSQVKIKTEKRLSPEPCDASKRTSSNKNESLTLDGCHLSWTFEAELPTDDGEEEDVPLLLLKNQKPVDIINTQIKSEAIDLNHKTTLNSDKTKATPGKTINNFESSLFIKKELIEDEIVSESQAVSAGNISNAKNNISTKLLPLKIKSEPIDIEYVENHSKTNASNSLKPFNNQLFVGSSTGLSKQSPKRKSKSSNSSVSADLTKQNSVLVKLLQSEITSVTNSSTHVSSNVNAENANFNILNAHSSISESLDSNKPITKKPKVSRKKKLVKAKAAHVAEKSENSFTQVSTHSELSVISSNTDSVNSLNEPTSNSKINFDTNNLSESSRKLIESIEAVVKKYSIENEETEVKSKTVSKESDLENFSLTVPTLETSANDKTNEILEKSATDSDTLILETDSQINSSKKEKRKKGAAEKDMNIDENIPITLLIKRQKTDTDANSTDSFLCTNISNKSYTVESCSILDKSQKNNFDQHQESSCISNKNDTTDNIISGETSAIPQNIKKKKTGKKKKLSKKKGKKNSSSAIIENDNTTAFFPSTPIEEPESSLSVDIALEETFSKKNKVKKGKNSSLYSESITVGEVSDQSSQDTVYAAPSPYDIQSEESFSSNSLQTSVSADINSQHEMNNPNSLAIQPKKKKKRQRNNGWYKKKKTRKEKEREKARRNMASADKVEIQNSVSDIFKDPLLFTVKTPVVVIKNLTSEIRNIENNTVKLVHNTDQIQISENNNVEINSESLVKSPVPSSSKAKKRKGNGSRKKKSKVSIKDNYAENENERILMETSVTESDKIPDNGSIEANCLQNELSKVSEGNSENHSLADTINESNINNSYESDSTVDVEFISDNEEVTITGSKSNSVDSNLVTITASKSNLVDSNLVNITGLKSNSGDSNVTSIAGGNLFPSLNVREFEKDIASIEALIMNKDNHDINSNSLGKNTSKTIETQNVDKSISLVKDTNTNLAEVSFERSVNTVNSDNVLSNIASIQSDNSICIKREFNVNDSEISVNQIKNTSQLNPFRATSSVQDSTANVTMRKSVLPSISIKKEKNVESQSCHKNRASKSTEISTQIPNETSGQTDSLVPSENAHKINSTQNSEYDASSNTSRVSHNLDINSLGLSIKKEVTHFGSEPSSTNLSNLNSALDSVRRFLSEPQPDHFSELQKKPLELLNNDDEIQIISKENAQKKIPIVELSDEDDIDNSSGTGNRNLSLTEQEALAIFNKRIELNKRIKTEKDNSKFSSGTAEASNESMQQSDSSNLISTFSFVPSDQIQSSVDPSKVRTNVSDSNIACTGSYVSEDPIKRETNNQFIVRDKYIDEYFKHPFPPSQISHKKRRNKSKIYERIESTAWNLSIDEVESRLKHAENTMSQFGKKLGDIVKLEKYPVSKSEVECYHRILGVAPSHKLLSKCYLTPNPDFLNNSFNKFELETKNASNLTINDILQGITESKNMCKNFDSEKNLSVFDRNCPSSETKDSFDSGISHSADACINIIPDTNTEQPNISLNRNNSDSPPENTFLTSQNSSLSCATNTETVSNNDVSNINTCINISSDSNVNSVLKPSGIPNLSYLQNDILANLNLPSKEVVNNILNSTRTSHSTTPEIPDVAPNCSTELNSTIINTTVNNESSLPSSYSPLGSGVSSEVNTNVSQAPVNTNKILDIINLPVVELRKILETASSLPLASKDNDTLQSDNVNSSLLLSNSVKSDSLHSDNVDQDAIWKNKETFEYNHTQSTPITNSDSGQNTKIQDANNDFPESVDPVGQIQNENSDDEYVDNEPIHYDSGNERSDSSSHENEESEEPAPMPQYKSKWEKIMERKSQELKEKEQINELYLKDCVPVSSCLKLQNKKSNLHNKVSQSADKKSEKSEEKRNSKPETRRKTNLEILHLLTKGKNKKQTESKNKTGAEGEKNNKSQNNKTEEEKINKSQNNKTEEEKINKSQNNKTEEEKINKSQKNETETEDEKNKSQKNKTEIEDENVNKSQKILKKVEKQNSKTNDPAAKKESPVKKNKNKEPDEVLDLFVPDKLVKTSPVKKPATSLKLSNEKNKSKRFYGNRVTNRGTFLTEANPAKNLTQIKIPKKKTSEIVKKSANVRSEEYHSMIKSPDINIDLPRGSAKNFNKAVDNRKNSEVYRSPLENASPSVTPHFIRTKRMRDRQNAYYNSRSPFVGKNESQGKKTTLLPTPYSKSPVSLNDETVPSRNLPLNHHESSVIQKVPLLSSPPSNSSHLPSDSFQSDVDPEKNMLRRIMSVFQNSSNTASRIEDNMLPNAVGNIDTGWNNNQYNSPFGATEPSVAQNINMQASLSADSVMSVSNPFRNQSHAVPLNLFRDADDRIGIQHNIRDVDDRVGIQHNINLPFTSTTPMNSSLVDSLDPRRAPIGLQSNMLPNSVMSVNSTLTDTLDPRRAALGLQTSMPIGASSADLVDPRRAAFASQLNPVKPLMPTNASFVNIPLGEPLDPRKAAQITHQASSGGSQVLNSSPFITPVTSTSQQPSRKSTSTCLVPAHLKTLVGYETIETDNVRLLMLEWSVDWLTQQQKNPEPPPISFRDLKKVTSSYDSFEDYYNTYFPLMLLETWHRIYVSWTHLNQTAPFLCQISSYSVRNHYVSVECQTVFSTDNRRKGVFPDEGSILMVKYATKSNEYTIRILGYVTLVKTRRYNPVTDSKLCSSCQQKDVNPDSLQVLTLVFMGAYNSEEIEKRHPVRIHVLCTVKHNLKQNDAMLFINESPLKRSILNPVADGLLTVSLTPRNSPEEKVNECVRDITKGILSPHPLPLLTVVRAKPESDRLNIIPLLIQKLKTSYKTKVLLCVRTVRALGDIAANICLQQSLKLVIINKRCDTNLQFQKYLLDELVASEAKKLEEETAGEKNLKSDAYLKIKKQIIKDCDVILSLIRNSHDDFLKQTFLETESIAQMCCIVDEANLCTEPETLIPILHGISKLILIGDPDYTAKVLSKKASTYDFNQSFFQRAYDLDLLTE